MITRDNLNLSITMELIELELNKRKQDNVTSHEIIGIGTNEYSRLDY